MSTRCGIYLIYRLWPVFSCVCSIYRCYERGREKCYRYWPEEGKIVTFSSVTVRCLGVTKSVDYVARNLEVSMKEVSQIEFKEFDMAISMTY